MRRQLASREMEVGVTDRAGLHAHEDVIRAWRRPGHLFQPERRALDGGGVVQPHRPHQGTAPRRVELCPSVRLSLAVAILIVTFAAACSRPPAPALVEYRDARHGFALRRPAQWQHDPGAMAGEVRFVPPGAPRSPGEFISVFTLPAAGPPTEAALRRAVFGLLPIHGVSGFQQDPRTTPQALWHKFEVTGTTDGVEWASVGVVVGTRERTQIAICATPLTAWREGQKVCDEVIRSFRTGG
jgi:hypothetical protein